ncbi:MAG: alpha/beta family hydrolase [Gammaproteobacteria bacterium]
MTRAETKPIAVAVDSDTRVSGLFSRGAKSKALFVFAPGAGAGITHSFMEDVAAGLAEREIATLRYQFPYMERGSGRPDAPPVCHATVRAAVEEAARLLPGVPVFAGGKSFGGRMTSQAQALSPLPGVRGIVFLGFPLHLAKKPSDTRAAHLSDVRIPMLFLQGTRDELADLTLLEPITRKLGSFATLEKIEAADHGFHVLVRSGRTNAQVMSELLDKISSWIGNDEGRPEAPTSHRRS